MLYSGVILRTIFCYNRIYKTDSGVCLECWTKVTVVRVETELHDEDTEVHLTDHVEPDTSPSVWRKSRGTGLLEWRSLNETPRSLLQRHCWTPTPEYRPYPSTVIKTTVHQTNRMSVSFDVLNWIEDQRNLVLTTEGWCKGTSCPLTFLTDVSPLIWGYNSPTVFYSALERNVGIRDGE